MIAPFFRRQNAANRCILRTNHPECNLSCLSATRTFSISVWIVAAKYVDKAGIDTGYTLGGWYHGDISL